MRFEFIPEKAGLIQSSCRPEKDSIFIRCHIIYYQGLMKPLTNLSHNQHDQPGYLAALLALAVFYRRRIHSWWTQRQQLRCEREDFYFKQFAKTARSNDPKAAFNSLMRWLDRIHTSQGAARLDEFLQRYGDKQSLAEVDRPERALSKESPG